MTSRSHTPTTCEACCPTCDTWQRVERDEDGAPELETQPCHNDDCTVRLCPHCPQFACDGCGLAHCQEHRIEYSGGSYCPICMAEMEIPA